ncbi:MAG: L-rhamnose mutarotase [Acidobacteria bacterium]|nr:MAG: L-rhamnose mutarotase [Acidobacteriota bacterium]
MSWRSASIDWANRAMNRHVLTVNLRNDPAAIAAYRDHHRRVWPEVVASLRRAGVRRMDIHLLGRTAVMVVDLADGLDLARVFANHQASSARVAEWERLMKSLQEPPADARPGEWWARMEPVFHLTEEEPVVAG